MKKLFTIALAALSLTACNRDDVKDIDFGVQASSITVKAGEAVNFGFSGNPDYIVFYPGTKECSYANRERTHIDLEHIDLSFGATQMYTTPDEYNNLDESLLTVYIAEQYTGSPLTTQWTQIGGRAEHPLQTPRPEGDKAVNVEIKAADNVMDLTAYLEKSFFLAFRYKAWPNNGVVGNYNKPRIQVKDLTLAKREPDGHVVNMSDCVNEWGFSVWTNNEDFETITLERNQFVVQPQAAFKKKDVEIWFVSTQITPEKVLPDTGMPIKSTNARLDNYSYTYDKPGTYTATFVATNATMWDSERAVRELTINVTE